MAEMAGACWPVLIDYWEATKRMLLFMSAAVQRRGSLREQISVSLLLKNLGPWIFPFYPFQEFPQSEPKVVELSARGVKYLCN
jgi:hypothetical protein